jgi:hypothetical protein
MGWKKKGKGFLHFGMCSFLSFLFLQRLQAMIDKPVASHESEKMMPKTTSIVHNGLINVESSSQRVVNELKVNSKESIIEDQDINTFLTTMEKTTSGDDLKDFSNQFIFNHVTSEEDEKAIASMKYEFFPSNQGQSIEILENVDQVILLVSNKPIESKAMVVVKSPFTSLERILKIDIFKISKDFLVVFG